MLIYTTQFINNYYKTLENIKLEETLQSLLNTILITVNNDLSLNNFDQETDNKLKKKSKFKKYDNYNSSKDFNNVNKFNKLNILQTTSVRKVPVDKTKINIAKSNIKALLNKLAPSNYNKLENEFLVIYNELLESSIQENIDELDSVDKSSVDKSSVDKSSVDKSSVDKSSMDKYIIDYICYNNITYSSIYVSVFFSLLNIYYIKNYTLENIFLYNLLKEKYEDFLNFEKYITNTNTNTNIKQEDEFTINKNNDKYKCFIIFIINIYKKTFIYELENTANLEKNNYIHNLFINTPIIEEFILLLHNFFITNLKIENNSAYCESILEFIITIYNELFKEIRVIKKIDANLKIYEAINSLLINKTNYISFTNKIKFKLMDVQDKYKKYILV
jgi:hypothetical protein